MNNELESKLYKNYPLLYVDRTKSMRETCMCWGICCNLGWYDLLDKLSAKLEKLIIEYKKEHPDLCCERCLCEKDSHYGSATLSPGKCLAVKKQPTKHVFSYKFPKTKYDFLNNLIPKVGNMVLDIRNFIFDRIFFKYETCYCEKFEHSYPKAAQVKEKYGTLKFYMTYATDEMYQLIHEAEAKSETICENCGKEGTLRTDGWWKVLCDDCLKNRYKKKGEE